MRTSMKLWVLPAIPIVGKSSSPPGSLTSLRDLGVGASATAAMLYLASKAPACILGVRLNIVEALFNLLPQCSDESTSGRGVHLLLGVLGESIAETGWLTNGECQDEFMRLIWRWTRHPSLSSPGDAWGSEDATQPRRGENQMDAKTRTLMVTSHTAQPPSIPCPLHFSVQTSPRRSLRHPCPNHIAIPLSSACFHRLLHDPPVCSMNEILRLSLDSAVRLTRLD